MNPTGRPLRRRDRQCAGIVPLGEPGRELLDGQRRPVALLGPGTALSKTVQALTGRAGRLQILHQGGALRGALGELLRALLQLAGGALQFRLPLLRGAFALGEAGLEVHQGLELSVRAAVLVRQVVKAAGAQHLGAGRLGHVGRCGCLNRLGLLLGGGVRLAGFQLDGSGVCPARFPTERGEPALRLTGKRLDQSSGRRLRMAVPTAGAGNGGGIGGTISTGGTAGLLGQVGRAALIGAGGQSDYGPPGAVEGCLLGRQVRPHPGGALGGLEACGVVGVLLGALGQPPALLDQRPASLQEVVEPLGLFSGGLSPGEVLRGGLGPGFGLLGAAA